MPPRAPQRSASLATSTACDLRLPVRIPDRPTPVGRSFFGPCSHLDFVIFVTVSLAIPRRIPSNIFFRWRIQLMRRFVRCVAVVSAAGALACTEAPAPVAPSRTISLNTSNASKELIPGEYIVVLNPAVQDVSGTARALVAAHAGSLGFTYTHALRGFSAHLSDVAAAALAQHPAVEYVEQAQMMILIVTETNTDMGLVRLVQ